MPPSIVPLTALADVKKWVNAAQNTDDGLLGDLISAVSLAIATYCNRVFGTQSFTETYNGEGGYKLFLRNGPITAVASLSIDTVAVPARTVVGASGFSFDNRIIYLDGFFFTYGNQNVQITYTAGLTYSKANYPDLYQAATEWVGLEYEARKHIDKKTEGLAQNSTTYAMAMPWQVKVVADRYRFMAPVS